MLEEKALPPAHALPLIISGRLTETLLASTPTLPEALRLGTAI